ncbi:peptidoglycan-binding protein [Streptomyces sp. NPDC058861]|uniref:peptidoglycan-binding protein n=1 Tax=Streptomyces sp. NPDC058861 TaxID=3346653 RepID=UPI0036CF214F
MTASSPSTSDPQIPPHHSDGHRRAPGLKRRRRALLVLLAGCLVCSAGGVYAGTLIKSPAQVAAETSPPPLAVLTAPVEQKVLSRAVITRGTVVASQRLAVTSDGPRAGAVRSIVTKVKTKPGETLTMGQVLVEISGRPVFVLQGSMPAYRDLTPGMEGSDVTQLQQALTSAGFTASGDPRGIFGDSTRSALTRFYRARGYTVPTTMDPDEPKPEMPDPKATDPSAPTRTAPVPVPSLPVSEIVYVPSIPAVVEDVKARVGSEASGELATIATGDLVVDGTVSPHEKGLLTVGQPVKIFSETTGLETEGTVASVSKTPKKPEQGQDQSRGELYPVKITPRTRLPHDLVGEDVRLTIEAATSKKEVLAVPVSAISAGVDGDASVTVRQDGEERRVRVRTGMTADGYIEVQPYTGEQLQRGDDVVVGVDTTTNGER